jgi:GABA(A) receptor-associated protein
MNTSFKDSIPFQKRFEEVLRVREKYPDRIPIIVEKSKYSKAPLIDKNKYLVPCELTVGQFIYVIRKRMSLKSYEALFLFINGTIPSTSQFMSVLYDLYKDNDGFLYINYSFENTFGNLNT